MEIIEDLKSQISFFGFEMTDADSLLALEKGEQTFVLYWAKDGFVLFETSKEGVWRANRPIVIPSERIQKVSVEKKLLGNPKLTLQYLDKEETYVMPMKCGFHQNQKVERQETHEYNRRIKRVVVWISLVHLKMKKLKI